jgi:hypothetical protein
MLLSGIIIYRMGPDIFRDQSFQEDLPSGDHQRIGCQGIIEFEK